MGRKAFGHQRSMSPATRAQNIADSIQRRCEEGRGWTFAEYGIAEKPAMVALVQAILSNDLDLAAQGREQMAAALRSGRIRVRVPRGTRVPKATTPGSNGGHPVAGSKMNRDRVLEFRTLRTDGATIDTLMAKYNISRALAVNIDKGKRWGSVV